MINRCCHLNIALGICNLMNIGCQFMPDPHSCPDYDEGVDRSYLEHYYKRKLKGVDLLEAELHRLGVRTERVAAEEIEPKAPDWF